MQKMLMILLCFVRVLKVLLAQQVQNRYVNFSGFLLIIIDKKDEVDQSGNNKQVNNFWPEEIVILPTDICMIRFGQGQELNFYTYTYIPLEANYKYICII